MRRCSISMQRSSQHNAQNQSIAEELSRSLFQRTERDEPMAGEKASQPCKSANSKSASRDGAMLTGG
jgi:hypothetical protein